MFDDSFEHSAENRSDAARIGARFLWRVRATLTPLFVGPVLIVDVFAPQLTRDERIALVALFTAV